jgi:hypothetical protein
MRDCLRRGSGKKKDRRDEDERGASDNHNPNNLRGHSCTWVITNVGDGFGGSYLALRCALEGDAFSLSSHKHLHLHYQRLHSHDF